MKATMRLLGIVVATFSVVSFGQATFEIGVYDVAKEMISYYRTVAYFFLDIPARLFGFHFPPPLMDIWALSFVGASAYVRTPNIEGARFFRRHPELTSVSHWRSIFGFLLGFSGLGLVILLSVLSPKTYVDEFHEEPLNLMKQTAWNVLCVVVGVIAFFALNAFGPPT